MRDHVDSADSHGPPQREARIERELDHLDAPTDVPLPLDGGRVTSLIVGRLSAHLDATGGAAVPRHAVMRRDAVGVDVGGGAIEPPTERAIARDRGHPLDRTTRDRMETALESDLSAVRIHTGGETDDLNRRLSAKAFTTGSDIFGRSHDYRPATHQGQRLPAHELTHVMQQRSSVGRIMIRRADLEVTGKSLGKSKTDGVFAFDIRSSVLDGDELKKVTKAVTDLKGKSIEVIGSASEDEPPGLDGARADVVRKALIGAGFPANDVKVGVDPLSRAPNSDYRNVREVYIAVAGPSDGIAVVDDAALPKDGLVPGDLGRVIKGDPRYDAYGVQPAIAQAESMLTKAISMLGSLSDTGPLEGTLADFRLFFSTASPKLVASNLSGALKQLSVYKPEAPTQPSDSSGGHACYDAREGGILFMNQGTGAEARMIVGVDALPLTLGGRAYNVVHEATHGTPGLETVDKAYGWQALFPILSPDEQLKNADSYALLVSRLNGLKEAPSEDAGQGEGKFDVPAIARDNVTVVGLPEETASLLRLTWAYSEHYATQVWLNLRDLYTSLANKADVKGTFAGAMHDAASNAFGRSIGQIEVAGLLDQVDDLKTAANKGRPTFASSTEVTSIKNAIAAPSTFGNARLAMEWQLASLIQNTPSIDSKNREPHARFIAATAAAGKFGGPFG